MTEANRLMVGQGKEDPGEPEWMPTNTLARQVARARREMGEAKWRRLNDEWNASPKEPIQ